jgi:hypothetical protein
MGIFSNKSSYYNHLDKVIKNEFDKNYTSEFNKNYSLRKNRFNERKKIMKYRKIKINDFPNWKTYLLSRLYPDLNEDWQFNFYNAINDENYENQYLFQNELFFEDFSISNMPQSIIKKINKNLQFETVLFPLDGEELSRCSTKSFLGSSTSIESKIINNVEKNNLSCHLEIEMSNEIYYPINDSTINSNKKLQNDLNNTNNINNIEKDQRENKSNIAHIKKLLIIILRQLKNNLHPITRVIKEFSEHFVSYINDSISKIQNNKYNKLKKEIIKEVQHFIEIMQVVLKLFYIKSINYQFFISERDEFINIISYILFNQKKDKKYDFYDSIYKIFQYSNESKENQLYEKINSFGKLTPKEAGVSPKFCLDEESEKFIKEYKNEKNEPEIKKTESKITKFLKDKENIKDENSNDDNDDSDEKINNEKKIYKKKSSKRKYSTSTDFNNDEDKRKLSSTSITYEEFANSYNSYKEKDQLKEKIEEKIDIFQTNREIKISLEDRTNYTTQISNKKEIDCIPYKKAIEYIKTIKDYRVPLEKLTVLAFASILITNSIDEYWEKEKDNLPKKFLTIDADELMSIYLYIVCNVKYKDSNIFTELDFIQYFTTIISKQSMVGYYYTTVNGCLNFILKVNNKESLVKNEI